MSKLSKYRVTIFFAMSIFAILSLLVSSIVMINQNGMDAQLQGWVNLLWLPLPLVILIVDRILAKKYGAEIVNKIELYIFAALVLIFILNLMRLNLQ